MLNPGPFQPRPAWVWSGAQKTHFGNAPGGSGAHHIYCPTLCKSTPIDPAYLLILFFWHQNEGTARTWPVLLRWLRSCTAECVVCSPELTPFHENPPRPGHQMVIPGAVLRVYHRSPDSTVQEDSTVQGHLGSCGSQDNLLGPLLRGLCFLKSHPHVIQWQTQLHSLTPFPPSSESTWRVSLPCPNTGHYETPSSILLRNLLGAAGPSFLYKGLHGVQCQPPTGG